MQDDLRRAFLQNVLKNPKCSSSVLTLTHDMQLKILLFLSNKYLFSSIVANNLDFIKANVAEIIAP